MPERAHITSLEALDSFRASLILYLSRARPALEEVTAEITRLRLWLEHDHPLQCEQTRRKQLIRLEQARQALASARYSNPRGVADQEQLAVRRAQQAVEQTEWKLRRAKAWSRDFDHHVEPLTRQLDQLLNLLATDMQKAVAFLTRTLRTLSQYTGSTAPGPGADAAAPSPAPSAGPESAS